MSAELPKTKFWGVVYDIDGPRITQFDESVIPVYALMLNEKFLAGGFDLYDLKALDDPGFLLPGAGKVFAQAKVALTEALQAGEGNYDKLPQMNSRRINGEDEYYVTHPAGGTEIIGRRTTFEFCVGNANPNSATPITTGRTKAPKPPVLAA